ncbi:hypothetical protein HD554DRAFT_2037702 [Boletus coccyginus]|nr:hypothetical protein HD554DRAFT_2037702 [Boletus coccyginus]
MGTANGSKRAVAFLPAIRYIFIVDSGGITKHALFGFLSASVATDADSQEGGDNMVKERMKEWEPADQILQADPSDGAHLMPPLSYSEAVESQAHHANAEDSEGSEATQMEKDGPASEVFGANSPDEPNEIMVQDISPLMQPEEQADLDGISDDGCSTPSEHSECSDHWVQTDSDAFDLFRQYHTSFPTYDPENMAYFGQFCDAPTFGDTPEDHQPWYSQITSLLSTANDEYFTPFLNASTYRLMSWFYNSSSSKSLGNLDQLVNNVILAEDFD